MPIVRLALDLPLSRLFDYRADDALRPRVGLRARVPFGNKEKIGIVVALPEESAVKEPQLKDVIALYDDLPPLPPDFFRLCAFASRYYQTPLGETLHQALPPALKKIPLRKSRNPKSETAPQKGVSPAHAKGSPAALPELSAAQAEAVKGVAESQGYAPFLLYGVTGSGKTEIYLRLIASALTRGRQALLLVPEINLTPQLERHLRARFPEVPMVFLHSALGAAARERVWRAAFSGAARIVVGTRLSVFAPLPDLGLIVVDEEHDPSYRQQDGLRYSARDLAIWRAREYAIPVVLGSATPSLESWQRARTGHYRLLTLPERAITSAKLPAVRLIDTRQCRLTDGVSPALMEALRQRLARGEQSLIFLNRRGYAPVLACPACGWLSGCPRCAANLVVHLADRRLRCHHCALETAIPRACPVCGNQDVHPFGRGTQRLEETLSGLFPEARIARVDRDSIKSRLQWEKLLERIHQGDADILVGTQMLAKGHDFPRLTLVGVLSADAALVAPDWRAPERLFAQLMQVAGRAGRASLPGEVLIQSQYPRHPLYQALVAHDYTRYAEVLLQERQAAGFPPFSYQALLRAEAPKMEDALSFLRAAREQSQSEAHAKVMLYDPVPMRLAKVMRLERAQLLTESFSRAALQAFLAQWRLTLEGLPRKRQLRWQLEVDPQEI
ncbi:MAG: primosomal protein N' [Zoogloeaceae bacterium]|nr:primosomal protein N' [Zoogloeaceae bacterium]